MWKKWKEKGLISYKRVQDDQYCLAEKALKGYVPVLVGREAAAAERFLVRVQLFKNPNLIFLLEMAEDELGHCPHGLLRIPCDVQHFRKVLAAISN